VVCLRRVIAAAALLAAISPVGSVAARGMPADCQLAGAVGQQCDGHHDMAGLSAATTADAVVVSIDRGQMLGRTRLALGVTHTQHSADSWGNPSAVAAARQLLRTSTVYQNQHVMGWGAENPEPARGQFDWTTLDARMELILSTGGVPVITLCCAPDWMKGGPPGTTDWSKLEAAPLPAHYADFAALAAAVAHRYPQVRHYQVWNELKGFWNSGANRWDYEGYTQLYNQVYDALKGVDPGIQVGGPYAVMDNDPAHQGLPSGFGNPTLQGAYGSIDPRTLDILSYWLTNKHGADFVSLDGLATTPGDPFGASQAFVDVAAWLQTQTQLPLWWAEWFVTPWGGAEYPDQQQNAVLTDALIAFARSGASAALRWQPQADPGRNDESVWTDSRQPGGGQPLPFYYSAKALHDVFPPGTPLYSVATSSPGVDVLASEAHQLLVNKRAAPTPVLLGEQALTLPPYGILLR
jgi:hypothetical protein